MTDALGAGKSADVAFKFGQIAIRLSGSSEYLNPKLIIKPTMEENDRKELSSDFENKYSAWKDYIVLSAKSFSTGLKRRYWVNILINQACTKPQIIKIVKIATKEQMECKKSDVLLMYFYLSPEDTGQVNWICKSEWINENFENEMSPQISDGEDIGSGIIIEWNNDYEEKAKIFNSFKISKETFLDKLNHILSRTKTLVSQMIELNKKYAKNELNDDNYLKSMATLGPKLNKLYRKATDVGIAPLECADLSQQFQNVMSRAYDISLPFSEHGLKTWEKKNRDYLVTSAIEEYRKELLRVQFELEKIHR